MKPAYPDLSPAPPARRPSPVLLRRRPADPAAKLWPRPVSGDDHGAVQPRRPHSLPRHWRRHRLLGWLRPLAWGLAIVGSPVAAVLWLYHSPRFALVDVEVAIGSDGSGSSPAGPEAPARVPEAWVRETVAPFAGRNLLRLSLAEVAARLEVHPWVKSVGLSKELPSVLGVRIVERRAVALLRDGGDLFYLERDGAVIAPLEGPPPPLVEVELAGSWRRPQSALAMLRELEDVAPEWLGGLRRILVLERDDFVLSTTDLPYPLLVRTGTVAGKVRRLQELLPEIRAHAGAGTAIDLRFARRIIIQPSAGSGAGVLAERIAGNASGRHS